jgi:hypothetical protein
MRDNSSRFAVPAEPAAPAAEEPAQPNITDLMSFVAPTQFVDLPSKGIHYPAGHPLHGKDSVEIKFMTAKEEDILSSQELIKKGVVLDRLIQSIIVDKRVNASSMLVGDKTAIMYAARISAYGEGYNAKFFCRSCNNAVSHEFDLTEIAPREEPNLDELGVTFEDGHYVCTLPATKVKVALRLLTGKDEREITDYLKKQKKNNVEVGALTTQMLYSVHSINGVTARAQLHQFIQNMPFRDSKYLRDIHAAVSPAMNTEVSLNCGNCGAEQEVELPMSVEFFWPRQ